MSTTASRPVLYSYWRSSCSWRVRIALLYKGLEFDTKPVNLIKDGGQQLTEEYRSLNPSATVPTLMIDGLKLTESVAILEYLEETYPTPPLLPAEPGPRAKARAVAHQIACGIQPLQNLKVLKFVGDDKKAQWGKHWIKTGFDVVEKMLEESAGKYCVGDSVSMADCCLIPQIANAHRFQVDMRPYPVVLRVQRALEELEEFQLSHPTKQPDCPEAERKPLKLKKRNLSVSPQKATSTPVESLAFICSPDLSSVLFETPGTSEFGLNPSIRFVNSDECFSQHSTGRSSSLLKCDHDPKPRRSLSDCGLFVSIEQNLDPNAANLTLGSPFSDVSCKKRRLM